MALLILILIILLKITVGVIKVVRVIVYSLKNNKSHLPLTKTWPLNLLSSVPTLNALKSIIIITKRYLLYNLPALCFRGLSLSIILNYCVTKLAT